jgi:hypothetical protein
VNPTHTDEETGTLTAQAIIDAWGDSKVILDYRWAQHCLDEGRLLLEQDNWGGFLVQPHADDSSDEDDAKRSAFPLGIGSQSSLGLMIRALPTPRPSPDNMPQAAPNSQHTTTLNPRNDSNIQRTSPSSSNLKTTPQPAHNGGLMAHGLQQQVLSAAEATVGAEGIPGAFTPEIWMSICDVMSQSEEPGYQALANQLLRGLGPGGNVPSGSTTMPPPAAFRHSSVHSQSEPPDMSASSRATSEEPSTSRKGKQKTTREKECFVRNGKPIEFFVQVDHVHRREIIAIIKVSALLRSVF